MRSNFFLFTNYCLSVLTALLGASMVYLYVYHEDDQTAHVMLLFTVLVGIPMIVSWISYVLKSSFGATLTAVMYLYPGVTVSRFIVYENQGSGEAEAQITILFFFFALLFIVPLLISASKQRKLNRKWEKV